MPLTALAVRQAKPRNAPYKLFDERGLFLLVNPTGSKLWRFKYHYAKKEKQLSVDLHAGLTHLLQFGSDPSQAMQIATFSMIWVPVGGSIFDARNGRYWVKFLCKSTRKTPDQVYYSQQPLTLAA